MADLVIHLCTGVIVKAVSGRPHVPIFLLGTVAPDLVSRVPSMSLTLLGQWGLPVPAEIIHAFEPLHLPAGIVILAAWVSLFFPARAEPGPLIFRAKRASGYQIYPIKPNLSLKCYIFL